MFDKSPTVGVEDLTARLQQVGDKPATIVLQRAGERLNLNVQAKKDDPAQFNTTARVGAATEVAEVVSDYIIMMDKNGKSLALTAKPAGTFVTTSPQAAGSIYVAADKEE